MPDDPNVTQVEIAPQGGVNIPTWLSPADQQQMKDDLALPKGSKEWKAAAKKWKKKTNDLKKAAAAAQGAAAAAGAAKDAQAVADEASSRAEDLEGAVLKGFGGKLKMLRIVLAGGIVILVVVGIALGAGGGGGGGKQGGGKVGADKKAPKAPIQWSEKIIGTNVEGASCDATTTIEFTIVDGDQYAGETAVVKMTGTENQSKQASVGAGGTFTVAFDHTLQPAGPGTCRDTETYSLASVGGDTNVAAGQTVG